MLNRPTAVSEFTDPFTEHGVDVVTTTAEDIGGADVWTGKADGRLNLRSPGACRHRVAGSCGLGCAAVEA